MAQKNFCGNFSSTLIWIFMILHYSNTSPDLIYTDLCQNCGVFSKFHTFSLKYTSNLIVSILHSTAFYVCTIWLFTLILLAGDVEQNPGPPKVAAATCLTCNKPIAGSPIHCIFCEHDFHIPCANLSTDDAKVFTDTKAPYICYTCEPAAKRYFRLEKRIENCENKLVDVDKKLDDVILTLNELKSNYDPNNSAPTSDFSKQFAELYEFESKKRNAVLFGLPRSDDEIGAIRALVKNSTVKPTDILYTFRDGPNRDKQGKTIDQFSKVVFSTSKARNDFLAIIRRSKDNNLRARPDLTFAQREAGRRLRTELDDRLEQGEQNLRIDYKNGKIVRDFGNRRMTRAFSNSQQ